MNEEKKKTLFIDLDGTAAEWRQAASLADLRTEGYFRTLRPTKLAGFINELVKKEQFDVYVLSAYMPETNALHEKNEWCDEHMPDVNEAHRIFLPCGMPKAAFIMDAFKRPLSKDDILIDDYSSNLIAWDDAGGTAVKWLNGMNGLGKKFKGTRLMWTQELREYLDAIA